MSADIEDMSMDLIQQPPHYTHGAIEAIDAIEAWGLSYHLGNVVKYICRHAHKGQPLQDLRKAAWYLERAIQQLEAEQPAVTISTNSEWAADDWATVRMSPVAAMRSRLGL